MCKLKNAVKDFRFLKRRSYPDKAALKLVGDRYCLTRVQRNCLFRGVVPRAVAQRRMAKLVRAEMVEGEALGIDWYNSLITVESYLKGLPVFLSDDGLMRDATGVHGSYRMGGVTDRAIGLFLREMPLLRADKIDIFLDAPVAYSGKMAADLRQRQSIAEVTVVPSPDYRLKSYAGIVASSDSVIVDRAERVFDLARYLLSRGYGFSPPDLLSLRLEMTDH